MNPDSDILQLTSGIFSQKEEHTVPTDLYFFIAPAEQTVCSTCFVAPSGRPVNCSIAAAILKKLFTSHHHHYFPSNLFSFREISN